MRCPVCSAELDEQAPFTEAERTALGGGEFSPILTRTYQHFICDNHRCRVSSLRIEWKASR